VLSVEGDAGQVDWRSENRISKRETRRTQRRNLLYDLVLFATPFNCISTPLSSLPRVHCFQIPRSTRHPFIDFLLFLPSIASIQSSTAFNMPRTSSISVFGLPRVARRVVGERLGELDEAVNRVETSCRGWRVKCKLA